MSRVKWIDTAKALTLLLVVLGHTLRYGTVRDIVYSMHVPCFFFLSGLIADEMLSSKSIRKDAIRLLIPYYSFGLISIAIYSVLGSIAASSFSMSTDSTWENIAKLLYGYPHLKFNAPLWFLPALFITKVLYKILYKILNGNGCAMFSISVLGSIVGFCYTNIKSYDLPFSLELILKLFPFFIAGKLFAPTLIALSNTPYKKHKCALFGIALLVTTCTLGAISPPVNYTNNSIPSPALFYIVAALGCISIYVVSLGMQSAGFLRIMGQKTLTILVLHKFPIVFFQLFGPFSNLLQEPDSMKSFIFAGIPVTVISILLSLVAGQIIEKFFPFLLGMKKRAFIS